MKQCIFFHHQCSVTLKYSKYHKLGLLELYPSAEGAFRAPQRIRLLFHSDSARLPSLTISTNHEHFIVNVQPLTGLIILLTDE